MTGAGAICPTGCACTTGVACTIIGAATTGGEVTMGGAPTTVTPAGTMRSSHGQQHTKGKRKMPARVRCVW